MSDYSHIHQLTPREVEVLQLMARGSRNQDVVCELGIGLRTVKMHVARIVNKLQANNRLHAVALGVSRGLVRVDEVEPNALQERIDAGVVGKG